MNRTKAKLLLLLATGVVVKTAWGQDAAKQQPPSASEGPAKICEPPRENLPREHRFWDKENRWLFAGVGPARTLDYFSSSFLRSLSCLPRRRLFSVDSQSLVLSSPPPSTCQLCSVSSSRASLVFL